MSRVVLDASVALVFLLREQGFEAIEEQLERWSIEEVEICVPAFFFSEVMNGIRRSVVRNLLREEEGDASFYMLKILPARSLPTPQPFEQAWNIAKMNRLVQTYDAEYLALAEREGCEFWTADRNLVNALGARRPSWVKELAF